MYYLRYILIAFVSLLLSGCFGAMVSEVKNIRNSQKLVKGTPPPPKLDQLDKELAERQEKRRKNVLLTLDIKKIFSDLEPNMDEFDELFKSSVSTRGYLSYKKHLSAKIEALAKKVKGKKYRESKIVYRMKVSKRKRKSKKEWVFGVGGKGDLKRFYKSFKRPATIEETKILFTPVSDKGKAAIVSEDDVTTVLKSEGRVVLYLYKMKLKKNKNKTGEKHKVFIIDIPTFLDYAL